MPNPLIKTFAKKANKNEKFVENQWNETKDELLAQGMKEDDKRFYPYLTTILKKKLKISEQSKVLKRFKEFLKEQIDKKDVLPV